ncbi:MAG TPA: phosphate ABC transporter permease PstA [Clostridia bacterium]|nr:MAG: Phosphate transport system permease protein PstA [Firmicutes bacterium ADurb.Bin146]HOD93457.1 phosphate ABC transporter permease PstA [Clostridia bacterium]HQM39751.1 phosphate ABC transporter permease PstA [Clostridia bacterium]
MKRAKTQTIFLRSIVYISAAITIMTVTGILLYILIKGLPHISWDLFAFKYTSENVSLFPAVVNTLTMTITALLMAAPLGIFSGIYLVEYANRNSKIVKVIRITTETLSGIPSIVYGLFGYLLFVAAFRWGYSMLAGAFSLAIMILPVIIRSTEESLKSVPDSYREGSFGLGAGKLRTVFKIVLPSAMPGILAGIILSIGRIVGETAVLIYTSGTVAQIPKNLMGSGRTLAVHLYALWSEGMNTESAYATAVILVITVIFLNAMSAYIAKKFTKGKKE